MINQIKKLLNYINIQGRKSIFSFPANSETESHQLLQKQLKKQTQKPNCIYFSRNKRPIYKITQAPLSIIEYQPTACWIGSTGGRTGAGHHCH